MLRPAFSLPLLIAAGLVRWDGIALTPAPAGRRQHRRRSR